jgi:hypothetical protein
MKVAQHFSAGFMLEKTDPSRKGRLKQSIPTSSSEDGNETRPSLRDGRVNKR